VAAAKLGRRFLGNDLNPEAVRLAATRLREFGAGREPVDMLPNADPGLLELMGPQP
jgi:hypothetical protein